MADITSSATWPSVSGQETATTTAGRQDESGHRRTKPSHAQGELPESVHQVAVDHSESRSELLDAVRRSGAFEVRMVHLATGDYLIGDQVLIERKTIGDLRASLVDGRLFPQVAGLSHSRYRSLLLIEGPTPVAGPDVHPHSIEGALVSIAAMWRLPVLHSCDPEQSVRLMRFLADQVRGPQERTLRRFDRKPKRLASKRLFLLQGLPGVGPALALRWRIACCITLAPSNASSPLTRLPWPVSEASARERPRTSASSSLMHRTRLTFAAPPGNDLY